MRFITFALALVACDRATPRRAPTPTASKAASRDAGVARDAAPQSDLWGVADFFMANVYEAPDFEARRLGWIRSGQRIDLGKQVEGGRFCPNGWYSLRDGSGFICAGKGIVVGRMPRSVRLGSAPASLDQLNPYVYGFITRDGTPLFRRHPTREEQAEVEASWAAQVALDAGADAAPEDGGLPSTPLPVLAEPVTPAPEADEGEDEDVDAGVDETEGGLLMRRMGKGNFVAVDRRVGHGGRLFYRTIRGNFVQANRLFPVGPPTFRGFELASGASPVPALAPPDAGPATTTDAAAPPLPLPPRDASPPDAGASPPPTLPAGVVYYWRARKFHQSPDGRRVFPRETLDRLTKFRVAAEITNADTLYYDTGEGWLVRAEDARKLVPRARPRGISETEKWIDVDISDQTLIAYVGDTPVYATVVATGLEDEEHATPRGRFRIYAKHVTFTMDDDRASDGPYSIEDVPYVMYFQLSYALHSSFWHGWYGRARSHGCVNLAPTDARWIFHFVTPSLPKGWYGVWAKTEEEGTVVIIKE